MEPSEFMLPVDPGTLSDISGDDIALFDTIDVSPGRSANNGRPYSGPATPLDDGFINISSPNSMHSIPNDSFVHVIQNMPMSVLGAASTYTEIQDSSQFLQFSELSATAGSAFNGSVTFPDTSPSIPIQTGAMQAHPDLSSFSGLSDYSPPSNFEIPNVIQQPSANILPWDLESSPNIFMPDHQLTQYDVISINSNSENSPVTHTPQSDNSESLSEPILIHRPARRTSDGSTRSVKGSRIAKKSKSPSAQSQVVSKPKFVIMTPNNMNLGDGQHGVYGCIGDMNLNRNTRGRKGPLNDKTKEAALEVRRKGACFCCRARKIKCGTERPCKNCVKLHEAVPQLVCWQFDDFVVALFPGFIRQHFREDAVNSFYAENIQDFMFNGKEHGLTVSLSSGGNFMSQLVIDTNVFTPLDEDVLKHWHLHSNNCNISMELRNAVPIGVNPKKKAEQVELAKRIKEYVAKLPREPYFAYQLTETMEHSDVSYHIICMVQRYARSAKSKLLDGALALYGMQYVMSRQLTLSHESLNALRYTGIPIDPNAQWVTSRVLNRQIKKIIDEHMRAELNMTFKRFEGSLKLKSRDEWAPCLASFLVLCLFMEAVEVMLETYTMTELQIQARTNVPTNATRRQACEANQEIEQLPFRQFVYQFHQIYQTYSKDASVAPFNPLTSRSQDLFESLDRPTQEFVRELRTFLKYKRSSSSVPNELDLLAQGEDSSAPSEDSPFPRDVNVLYAGRLVSRFLLSFEKEEYILVSPPRITKLR